jgi:nitrogen fixation NifU-like protein
MLLYQEVILDHYRNPVNKGLTGWGALSHKVNPICGDEVTVEIHDGVQVWWDGQGCSISQAAASILADTIEGLTCSQALEVIQQFKTMMTSGDVGEGLGDAAAFEGVRRYPARINCALLAWHAAHDALQQTGE